jgi:membrane protease YdiL (CAAX protease family)
MVTTLAAATRLTGLGVALVALIRETWMLRAPGTLPIARLVQRELQSKLRTSQLGVCLAAGVLLAAAPIGWSIALGHATLTSDPQWRLASLIAVAATVVVKLLWVFFEELAFRAALITAVARRVGVPIAVVVSAVAFAAAHGRDPLSSAVLVADGLGFSVAYVTTRSIQAPIAWHLGKNLAVWLGTGQSTLQFAALPYRLVGAPNDAADLGFTILIVSLTSLALLRLARTATPAAQRTSGHASTLGGSPD